MDKFQRHISSGHFLKDRLEFFPWLKTVLQVAANHDLYKPKADGEAADAPRVFIPAVFTIIATVALSSDYKTMFDAKFDLLTGAEPLLFTKDSFVTFMLEKVLFREEDKWMLLEKYTSTKAPFKNVAAFTSFSNTRLLVEFFELIADDKSLEFVTTKLLYTNRDANILLIAKWLAKPPTNMANAMSELLDYAISPGAKPQAQQDEVFFTAGDRGSQRGRSSQHAKPTRTDSRPAQAPPRFTPHYKPSPTTITCKNCGLPNHVSTDCLGPREAGKSGEPLPRYKPSREPFNCNNCRGINHLSVDCQGPREAKSQRGSHSTRVSFASETKYSPATILATHPTPDPTQTKPPPLDAQMTRTVDDHVVASLKVEPALLPPVSDTHIIAQPLHTNDDDAVTILLTTSPHVLEMIFAEFPLTQCPTTKEWIVDGGCTRMITGNRDLFKDFSPTTAHDSVQFVKVATNKVARVMGKGSVLLVFSSKAIAPILLRNVLYVPDIPLNLFSPASFFADTDAPSSLHLDSEPHSSYLQVRHVPKIYLTQYPNSRLWYLPETAHTEKLTDSVLISQDAAQTDKPQLAAKKKPKVSISVEEARQWHIRMGHLNYNQLAQYLRTLGITVSAFIQNMDCVICAKMKQAHSTIALHYNLPRPPNITAGSLVHMDIVGPFEEPGYDGAKFALAFTDDHTNMRRWYTMRTKDQAPDIVQQLFNDSKTNTPASGAHFPVRGGLTDGTTFHGDNDSVFVSKEMKDLMASLQCRLQTAPNYTPTSNAKAERGHRTIVDRARALLAQAKLPPSQWPRALLHAVHITNLAPCSTNTDSISPYQKLTGLPPTELLDKLRVFGCAAFVTVEADARTKLAPKAKEGKYIGYSPINGSHLIKMHDSGRTVSSIHVTFQEQSPTDPLLSRPVRRLADLEKSAKTTAKTPPLNQQNSTAPSETTPTPNLPQTPTQPNVPPITAAQPTAIGLPPTLTNLFPQLPSMNLSPEQLAEINRPGPRLNILGNPLAPNAYNTSCTTSSNQSLPEPSIDTNLSGETFTLPTSLKNAFIPSRPDGPQWKESFTSEFNSLQDNGTFKTVRRIDLPSGTNILRSKTLFKLKPTVDPNIFKRKTRIVACGYTQIPDVDYNPAEIFAPVIRHTSLRIILAMSAFEDDEIDSIDVRTAFLNGTLDPNTLIYMYPPEPQYDDAGCEIVWLLLKSIYGLKQSPRIWHDTDVEFLTSEAGLNLLQCKSDPCLFFNRPSKPRLRLGLWVDDHFMGGARTTLNWARDKLQSRFEVTYLGPLQLALGMRIARNRQSRSLTITSADYIRALAVKHRMEGLNPTPTPLPPHTIVTQNFPHPQTVPDHLLAALIGMINDPSLDYRGLIGALLYLANTTRPEISVAVNMLARFMASYTHAHFTLAKHILRFLMGTINDGITFGPQQNIQPASDPHLFSPTELYAYSDADWATCPMDRISIGGSVQFLYGAVISWKSKKQKTPALSSGESEFMALSCCAQDCLFIRNILIDLGYPQPSTTIFEDNQSAIHLAHNPSVSERTKHIDVRYHFIRYYVNRRDLKIVHVPTALQIADVLTKNLPIPKFQFFSSILLNKPRI